MPLQLLREISWKTLPVTLHEDEDIEQARVLRACGYAAVLFSVAHAVRPFARVLALTPAGLEAMRAAAEDAVPEEAMLARQSPAPQRAAWLAQARR
ncbi:MAG: hypothetical protein JWP29_2774 [Rhodoferax sp.]|nr:hypothetical protein [Rhodoferax sp.]